MLDELIAPLGSAIANVPVGTASTWRRCRSVTARIDGDKKTLEVLEPAVEPEADE